LASDAKCAAYLQTSDFIRDFAELLAHGKQAFDMPAGWQEKEMAVSMNPRSQENV